MDRVRISGWPGWLCVAVGVVVAGLIGPRVLGASLWNLVGVQSARQAANSQTICRPFYESVDACLETIGQLAPAVRVMWAEGWQYLQRAEYDQAAAAVSVACTSDYVPGADGRRVEYLLVELLALARQGCESNAEQLWTWISHEAPYHWPDWLQPIALRSGAIAWEWLATQDQAKAPQRRLWAAELWWLAGERAKSAGLLTRIMQTAAAQVNAPDLTGQANWYLGAYAEETGDLAAAQASYARAVEARPQWVEALLRLRAVALARGDVTAARVATKQLTHISPPYPMPRGGIKLDNGYTLLGYDQQAAAPGLWLRIVVFWQVDAHASSTSSARRCFQSLSTLDLGRYDRQTLVADLRLMPNPISSLNPIPISRIFERDTSSATSYVIYSLRSAVPEADVTITVRPSAVNGQHFTDLNNSLRVLMVADSAAAGADATHVTARYAVQLPDSADHAEVTLTVHQAPVPVSVDKILVAQIPGPDDSNMVCLDIVP